METIDGQEEQTQKDVDPIRSYIEREASKTKESTIEEKIELIAILSYD